MPITNTQGFTYSDIDPNFSMNALTGDVGAITDNQAIINSCKNLILTQLYRRPFQQNIGAGLETDLFELATPTTASNMQLKIQNVIATYEPRVESVNASVVQNSDQTGYNVTVVILPKNSLQPVNFTMFLQRVL